MTKPPRRITPAPSYRRLAGAGGSLAWGVVAAALAAGLLRGGFFATGQLAFAAAAGLGIVVLVLHRGRGWGRLAADPVLAGLVVLALANAAAAVAAGRSDTVAPALAACGFPVIYGLARLPGRSPAPAAAVVAVSSIAAVAGITALLLHAGPDAERIAGVWRAGGTYEYPPALALACVCGLACVLALAAEGAIERGTALLVAGLLCAAIALTYDRAGAVMAVGVLVLFGRLAGRRRLVATALLAAAVAGVAVAVAARPDVARLEQHLRHDPIASRADTWSDAWRAVRRRPVVGSGPGGYPRIYRGSADPTRTARAHDTVLEQAVEGGLVAGLAAALVVVAGLVRALPRLTSRDPTMLAWACVATAVLASGLYDFTWSFPPLAAMGLVALGRLNADRAAPPPSVIRRPGSPEQPQRRTLARTRR